MRKQIWILLLILSLLFILTACKSQPKTSTTGFIGGKEGLSASIAIESTSGGNNIYDADTDPFRVLLTLQNKGEDDVAESDVVVELTGVNFQAFQIRDAVQRNTLPLSGLRREAGRVTAPSQIPVVYDAKYKPNVEVDRPADLTANFCYKYQTISEVNSLCLRKRITGPSGNSSCKIDETKPAGNSGAPFQVKTFTERPAGENKVAIWVEAQKEGKGTIYSKDFLSQGRCMDDTENKNKMFVKVELPEIPNSASLITCSGLTGNQGFVNVIQDKIQLSCNIDTTSLQESTFETALTLTFDYVYKDSVSTTLTVKSST